MSSGQKREERTATHSMSLENEMLLGAEMLLIIFSDSSLKHFSSAFDVSLLVQIEKIPPLIVQFVERRRKSEELAKLIIRGKNSSGRSTMIE